MNHPHMAECAVESYRMWGEHVGSIMDCRERRAARGNCAFWRVHPIARKRIGHVPSWLSLEGWTSERIASAFCVQADSVAALALDFWSGRWSGCAPHGPRPRAGQGAGRLVGDRDAVGAGRVGAAELDLAAFGRRDRERTGERISTSRLSVVLKKGASPGVGAAPR